MSTYTKETALYDTGAIATDIANAGTTATSYITRVDATNGIRVHDLNESTDFVQVNSSAISMYRGGTSADNEKVRIEDDEIRVGATTTGHAILDEDGMDVYIGDTSVAHYGDYARVGKEGEANTTISPSEVIISAGNNINALRITPDGNTQTIHNSITKQYLINAGKTYTFTQPSAIPSGTTAQYKLRQKSTNSRASFEIKKGTSKSTTSVTTPYPFQYSATTTQVTIKNTGSVAFYLQSIDYSTTEVSPLIEAGGVLTLGQYPYIASDTMLVVGNGTSDTAVSNVFEVDNSGNVSSSGGLYPYNTWMGDFVVEEGNDGIWTYRKWFYGTAECWGSYSETKSHAGTVFGGYSYTVAVYFPTNLFTEVPIVTYGAYLGNQFALTGTLTNSFSKSSISLWAVCNTSGSKTTTWHIKAIGRWK